jgi:ligand-binding sensor domain-containing protein/signal transduction histidine kinase
MPREKEDENERKAEEKNCFSGRASRFVFSFFHFFAFLILLFTQNIPAQYRFDSFTTDNGLPQNGVRSIAQTPDGYLWFTTFDGLVRFDGVKFTVFDKNNTKGIAGNRFSTLHAEPDGTLFAGTEESGLTVYQNGNFKTLTTADGLPSNVIYPFRRDTKGEFFVVTAAGNCYIRDGKIIPAGQIEVPNNNFSFLSPKGDLWFYKDNSIHQITPDKLTVNYAIKIDHPSEMLSGIKPFEDSKDNLWFGDLSGIYILKNGAFSKLTEKDGVPPKTLLTPFVEDEDGGIWFSSGWGSTRELGLVRYFQGEFSNWGTDAGLSNLQIKEIFKDREGSIWVSTDKGLNHLRKQFITSYPTDSELPRKEVYPLLQAKNGDIYIGTTEGLSVYRNGKFSALDLRNKLGDKISVTALFEDEKQRLWIGAVGDLHVLENGKLRQFQELFQKTVWAIKNDRAGNIWVASEKGLFKFRDDQVIAKYTTAEGLPSDDVKVIHEDRSGTLWFGTYGGLVKFDGVKFTLFTTENGLAGNRVRSIYEDEKDVLWIGTYDSGLSRLVDGKFVNYTVENGLFNNGVFQILEDRKNNFWISCNKGIYRVNRRELEDFADGKISKVNSIAYGKTDGMRNTEANGGRQPAGLKTADGRLWFPTQDGVSVVNPAEVPFNPNPPPVKIENVLIDRTATDFQDGIRLQANENNLEIRYTGISFIKPEQVKFRYRIEGLGENWTDVRNIREVYFPSLPAGEYTFHVIAANSDGVWNEEGAKLKIFVNAPFWKKNWFIALATLLVILIIILIFKLRERELKRRQMIQQEFSRKLLESQESERKRIASEMHDSLGQYLLAIKNWAMFGLNSLPEKDAAREYLTEVSETSSLAIEEVREIAHNLRPYQLERLGLTNTLEYMFKNLKNSAALRFFYEIEQIDGFLSKPDEIVFYRIVQECLNNVIKHSHAANAWLSVKLKDNLIEFICRDDGHGFDFETAQNSSKSGLGLNGIAERVKILKGEYNIESEIEKGTKVIVRVGKNE